MAPQQARHRPERPADCRPTPIITRQCNTQHINPDKWYTRRIRIRRCPLRLMPRLLPGNRIEELASCHDYRLLKDTPIPVGHLRHCHTDESHRTNYRHSHHFPPRRTLPVQDRPSPMSLVSVPSYSRVTNFEYTLTFASRPSDPIINKTADSPITHHAEPS
ncbi:hypothetical protein EDB84DRAFT_173788 [Lactarius hengduanensis]|nr:hypothetical protein EDB84DRAFT_173788 [Lactarius hengduanensis]